MDQSVRYKVQVTNWSGNWYTLYASADLAMARKDMLARDKNADVKLELRLIAVRSDEAFEIIEELGKSPRDRQPGVNPEGR